MASRGNVSIPDATANYVGWLMPALAGYVEDVAFPPHVSTELRADSISLIAGTVVTGDVTWANIGGPFAATAAAVVMHNVSVTGSFTVTDDGVVPGAIIFGGDEALASVALGGLFDSSLTTGLGSVFFEKATISGGINAGVAADSALVELINSAVVGTLAARFLVAQNSSLNVSTIAVNIAQSATFLNCTFSLLSNPVLTGLGAGPVFNFDGPSWRSFSEAGGTRAPGMVALVVGGYSGGAVEGAALAAASTSVALNGVGATAGFTEENSGNHYSTASITPTTVTLLTAGAQNGDTLLITRTAVVAANLAVVNGGVGAGTIGTIPTGTKGFVLAQFDGTDWVFAEGGSLAA
jgi:hypothetical protein